MPARSAGEIARAVARRLRPKPSLDRLPDGTEIPATAATPVAEIDTLGLADGQLTATATGGRVSNFGPSPATIRDGAWTHNVSGFVNCAAYVEVSLPAPVTRAGVVARFAGERPGAVALVLPSTSWTGSRDGWCAGAHFVLRGDGRWNVGRWANKQIRPVYAAGNVGDLRGGEARVELVVDRDAGVLYLDLPGGVRGRVASPFIGVDTSAYAVFELYENNSSETPAQVTRMWADATASRTVNG